MRYVLEGWKSFSYHGTDLSQGYPLYEYRGGVRLVISPNPKYEQPVVDVRLREWVTSYRAVLCPDCVYYWKLIPFEGETEYPQARHLILVSYGS